MPGSWFEAWSTAALAPVGVNQPPGGTAQPGRLPVWVRLGHSATSVQCPVCRKADTA